MQEKSCMHCYITGKVQGVWFRASAQEQAKQLGLTGWARNLPDGRVEVFACGEKTKLAELSVWLQQGPQLAKVTEVTREDVPWREIKHFTVE